MLLFSDGIDSPNLGGPNCPLLSPVGPPPETLDDRIINAISTGRSVSFEASELLPVLSDEELIKPKKPRKRLTKDSPKKAYKVLEVDEHTGGIVFARCNAEARRWGANEYGDGEWDYVECSRAPEYDQYVNGGLNDLVLWNNGWWFECMCGHRLDSDFYDERRYEREDKFKGKRVCEVLGPIRDEPVLWKHQLYCSPWCRLSTAERWGKEKADKALAVTMAKLTGKFEGCTILEGQVRTDRVQVGTHTFVDDWGRERVAPTYQEQRVFGVRFTFPGGQYGGSWVHTKPTKVFISQADVEAWDTFKGKTSDGSLPDRDL